MTPALPAYRVLRPSGGSRFVLVCDHASNRIPDDLHNLGLGRADLERHIAWDIGAAGVTEWLSETLDAPAVLSGASRLVIDCNRQLEAPSLIPETSDGTSVPGNVGLTTAARAGRIEDYFRPYHGAVEAVLTARADRGQEPVLVSIHSMTPSLGGVSRPWAIALSSHLDRRLTEPALEALRSLGQATGYRVGDNEPYSIDAAVDFTTPFHAIRRGWNYLQVEFRQDEVADPPAQRLWAGRFAQALQMASHAGLV